MADRNPQPWNRLPPLPPRRKPTVTEHLDVIMPQLWPYLPLMVLVALVLGFAAGLNLHGLA